MAEKFQRTVSLMLRDSPGAERIVLERDRQVWEEGFPADHDDTEHDPGVLAQAGGCYIDCAVSQLRRDENESLYFSAVPARWPWRERWWKPSDDPVRNLVKGGALIAAEIDRILRRREEAFGLEAEHGLSVQDDPDGV